MYTLYDNGLVVRDAIEIIPLWTPNHPAVIEYQAWVNAGNLPTQEPYSNYLTAVAQHNSMLSTIRNEYIDTVQALSDIENTRIIPFTQAGFNQVIQAVKVIAKVNRLQLRLLRYLILR